MFYTRCAHTVAHCITLANKKRNYFVVSLNQILHYCEHEVLTVHGNEFRTKAFPHLELFMARTDTKAVKTMFNVFSYDAVFGRYSSL